MAPLARIFAHVWPHRLRLFGALVSLALAAGLGLVYPFCLGQLIDSAYTGAGLATLQRQTLVLLGVFATQALFIFTRHYLLSWVGERVVADLRETLYGHMLTLSPAYFHHRRSGELLALLATDVTKIQRTVSADISLGARSSLTVAGGIAVMAWTNLGLTALVLALVPPAVLVSHLFGGKIRQRADAAQAAYARATGDLQEGITGIETVQAFVREGYELGRYVEALDGAFTLAERRFRVGAYFVGTSSLINFAVTAAILYCGARAVHSGAMSPGELMAYMVYMVIVATAIEGLAGLWTNIQSAVGATRRVFELLDTEPEIRDRKGARPLTAIAGSVRFERVCFTYPGRATPAVERIEFELEPGQLCALVGPSGAGKTSLARLLYRFHDPGEGRIILDGFDLRELRLADLRGAFAWVAQDPILFSGTVFDNIRYGRLNAKDGEVLAAAEAANVDEFVCQLPQGYDTPIGERGIQLSGGQRQRVAIARALLRDPKLLVLDEATSALDSGNEALIQAGLTRLRADRTTLVIAHRLSTIRDADMILMLDEGRIVERGTYDELMARGDRFATLVAHQARGAAIG